MPGSPRYEELLFKLGDLARERLANRPNRPKSMERVFKAEHMLVARRDEVDQLEEQMNAIDDDYRQFVADSDAEQAEHSVLLTKWKKLIDSLEAKAKDARKRLLKKKAELKKLKTDVTTLEKRQAELEIQSPEVASAGREKLKKYRLFALRTQREVEELNAEVDRELQVAPGHPGEHALAAHRRVLELEEERVLRKANRERDLAEVDEAIAQKEAEARAAEDHLERALRGLGEEVYQLRIEDPVLTPLYLKLDGAK